MIILERYFLMKNLINNHLNIMAELTRSQYKQLLEAVENNIEIADKIADLIESWSAQSKSIVPPNFVFTPTMPGTWVPTAGMTAVWVEVTRTGFWKNPKQIGGITDDDGKLFNP